MLLALSWPGGARADQPATPSRGPDVIYVPTPVQVGGERMLQLGKVDKSDVV